MSSHMPRLAELRRLLQSEKAIELSTQFSATPSTVPMNDLTNQFGLNRRVFIETYGCQMNTSDTEIIQSLLTSSGFQLVDDEKMADILLFNTCAIRDNAEQKIWHRLEHFRHRRAHSRNPSKEMHPASTVSSMPPRRVRDRKLTVGVLGCMAERLKDRLLEDGQLVDVVVGPDAYRDLPRLLNAVIDAGQPNAMNVMLSADETYADITPVRTAANGLSAFVSIMRGCNELCSYCIVPFTRGRERSRPVASIEDEISMLADQGYKEVTLLGQNVNAYNDLTTPPSGHYLPTYAPGFDSNVKVSQSGTRFVELLDRLSRQHPDVRIRFTSPHPKDFSDDIWHLVADRPNICQSFHIPAQSGSSTVLERMRRQYTREAYIGLIERMRAILPHAAVSSDFISGFCGETEAEHQETISLLQTIEFDHAFMFAYSMREKTRAHRRLQDDVPEEVKKRRLNEVIDTFYSGIKVKNQREIGRTHIVLLEETSKKSDQELAGRSDTNKRVIIDPTVAIHDVDALSSFQRPPKIGDYVKVQITGTSGPTLRGVPVAVSNSFLRLQGDL